MAANLSSEGDGEINEINITPFVDVVLVLLVIFMVTAPAMIKESLKVKLPKTLTSDLAGEGDQVGVAITKTGQVLLNGKIQSYETLNESLKAYNPETRFMIMADVDSKHGELVRFIDLLKQNNLNRFALQVERVNKSEKNNDEEVEEIETGKGE
jgi:biopolymer transport protein ExbD